MKLTRKIDIKKRIKNFFHLFGLDIIKWRPRNYTLLRLLKVHNIDLVFDVGANAGQYANMLFQMGYNGKVISFEPLSSRYNMLLEWSKSNSNWEVAERCAIGDINGEIKLNISKNLFSNSILPNSDLLTNVMPDATYMNS
ncbi:MAG: FkbM family methyltransferase, partial [Candidatus Thorarchaeota archaeon]